MKVISIVGASGSGKTTLIKKLIPELKKKRLNVAVIKHTSGKIQSNKKGKDSEIFFNAGCSAVAVLSEKETAVRLRKYPLKKLLALFGEYDLVITEGFKKEKFPKIEVIKNSSRRLAMGPPVIAVVGDGDTKIGAPFFKNKEITKISDFIIKICRRQIAYSEVLFFDV